MLHLKKISLLFFAIGMAGIGVLQFIYNAPRPVIMPVVPAWLGPAGLWGWVTGIGFIAMAVAIAANRWAKQAALLCTWFLLLCTLLGAVPYQLNHYPAHLGSWTNPLKELCLSGCALIVAGCLDYTAEPTPFFRTLEKLIPAGVYFFGIMHLLFGIDHFLYQDFVASLIAGWIPGHLFFTYLSGVALIAAGAGILLNVQRQLAAYLLAAILFIWVLLLHLPRAVANTGGDEGNEWTSVFEALAFSGVAFLIGTKARRNALKPRQGIATVHSQGRAAR